MALKVLTLNVWGLHYIAQRVRERLCCIAQELKGYDIVGLQEVWSQDDYQYLVGELNRILPYSFRFKSGVIGSGLCVFSRYPIISVHGQQFTVAAALKEFKSGELFAGKGMLSCRIMTPTGPLLFVTIHTNGRYRDSQVYEMTKLIGGNRGSDPVILCGDFNTCDNSPAYRLLTHYLGLKDAFAGCTANTCNLSSNIYTKRVKPMRIDFVFYSSDRCRSIEMDVQSKRLALSGTIQGKDFPYSDHEGLEVVFVLRERTQPMAPQSMLLDGNAVAVLEEIAQKIYNRKKDHQAERPHCRTVATGAGFFVILLLVSGIFGNRLAMTYLGTYYLGFFILLGVGILGACLMWAWLVPLFNIRLVNGMESHINEIRTRLSYNRTIASESSGDNYHLM